jgi:hypothetical protein
MSLALSLGLGVTALLLAPLAAASLKAMGQENQPTPLFTLPEYDLYPENIAFDSVSGDFFLGSMAQSRILRIHQDGSYEDFVSGLEPLLESSVGMKVDAQRRRLWVCSGRFTVFGGSATDPPQTGVLLFDLDDGSLIRSWMVDQPSPYHIFNDLVLTAEGEAYATTTLFGRIVRIDPDAEEMEVVLETPERHNNGITLDSSGRYLFFTLDRTISRLDLETEEVIPVQAPEGADLGTDGLYFYEGALIAVKPRFSQILRLNLNPSLDAVENLQILVQEDPELAYPTTGVVVEDRLVFVATSYADNPRNSESTRQHPEVRIHAVDLVRPPVNSPSPGHAILEVDADSHVVPRRAPLRGRIAVSRAVVDPKQ